jgi:hypothetical protein
MSIAVIMGEEQVEESDVSNVGVLTLQMLAPPTSGTDNLQINSPLTYFMN